MNLKKNFELMSLPKTFMSEKDYFLGGTVYVFVKDINLEVNIKITEIIETFDREKGYNLEMKIGEELPSIFSILKQKREVR